MGCHLGVDVEAFQRLSVDFRGFMMYQGVLEDFRALQKKIKGSFWRSPRGFKRRLLTVSRRFNGFHAVLDMSFIRY